MGRQTGLAARWGSLWIGGAVLVAVLTAYSGGYLWLRYERAQIMRVEAVPGVHEEMYLTCMVFDRSRMLDRVLLPVFGPGLWMDHAQTGMVVVHRDGRTSRWVLPKR